MKVLLIIDMLNGFCRKGFPLSLENSTENIEGYISKRIEETIKEKGKVVFICDSHKMTDPEINNPYPPHCMEGSEEAEIVNTLIKYADKSMILKKHTLSIIFNTGLEKILNKLKPTEIEIAGVCTDICDLFAVYELRTRGFNVFVSNQGVLPLDKTKQIEYLDYFKNRLGARTD